jgi:hypothetical protein
MDNPTPKDFAQQILAFCPPRTRTDSDFRQTKFRSEKAGSVAARARQTSYRYHLVD